MKLIKAKYNSRCADTTHPIKKGEYCYYDQINKKVYWYDCQRATDWRESKEKENDFVQDPGEIDSDNFCQQNNI